MICIERAVYWHGERSDSNGRDPALPPLYDEDAVLERHGSLLRLAIDKRRVLAAAQQKPTRLVLAAEHYELPYLGRSRCASLSCWPRLFLSHQTSPALSSVNQTPGK